MEKNGMLTEESKNDFSTKKAKYYDKRGFAVADEENKHKLKEPARLDDSKTISE